MKNADATGTDEQSDDDEDDAPEEIATSQDDVDPGDDQYDGDEPKKCTHGHPTALTNALLTS
ncbi:hypothetical protein Sme01_68760 [Sphaerisporangium melleum]|uniref:Uncharacterized protein n=1 Tax=Sphaerisporangium melleum TaxID=321316 RepID=A0A917RKI4_9ACTN|nr:hypothetical protein GCM10007964_62790 [Sphaerisporangium melleum]GII74400.1 hypothetical protein Sme01_68760 [Sphaerisporangium melleum]